MGARRSSVRREWRVLVAVVALSGTPRTVLADDAQPKPVRTETPCSVPHFTGTIVERAWQKACATGAPCSTDHELTLENADSVRVFGVHAATQTADPAPPSLACSEGFIVLRWQGQALRFEVRDGGLRLSPADHRRIADLWRTPEARTPEGIAAHDALAAELALVAAGLDHSERRLPGAVDAELVAVADLVSIRDHLRAGQFQVAADGLARLEARQAESQARQSARTLAPHLVELRHELAAARRRTQPFSLGPRRLVGGAQRVLRTPLDAGGPPELFFRAAELCVADVAPEAPAPPLRSAWPEDRMYCFTPGAATPRESEPRTLPASSAANVVASEAGPAWNRALLAVVDGDALLEVSHGELALVRSGAATEQVSPARARELVAGSAGTRLLARTASYFTDSERVVQVAGAATKTWEVFGLPPEHVQWVGTPLVSPDQRWVVAQSGDGHHAVSLWVFPIH